MRTFCFLFACLTSASITFAQTPAATPAPAAAAFTRADSAVALHHYFQHKRQLGAILTVGALAAPVAAGVAAGKETDALNRGLGYVVGLPLASALPLGFWIFHRQYNRRHEERALLALQAGTLAPELRRKLKPAYFRP